MMTTLAKLVLPALLLLLTTTVNLFCGKPGVTAYTTAIHAEDVVKTKALEVLTNKCNVCHEKRNRRRVFTTESMDEWAEDVYKQVFIKKRMPKGKNIKLTTQEYQDLLTWISSTKN